MLVPDSIKPLLASFSESTPNEMWWLVVEEFVQACPKDNLRAMAQDLTNLASSKISDETLSNTLVELGCYHWPGAQSGYRKWLNEVAQKLLEKGTPKKTRQLPPIFSPGGHKGKNK